MLNIPVVLRFLLGARLLLSAACFTFAAYGGSVNPAGFAVQVNGGSIVSTPSTLWSEPCCSTLLEAGGWEYGYISGGPGSSIFYSSANIFGLTDSEFECVNPSGCGALDINFYLLGVPISGSGGLTLPGALSIDLDGNTTFGGSSLEALYFVSVSPSTEVLLTDAEGSLSSVPFCFETFCLSNDATPVMISCELFANCNVFPAPQDLRSGRAGRSAAGP
jgi:hypothetical protein